MKYNSLIIRLTLCMAMIIAILVVFFSWITLTRERTMLLQEVQNGLSMASDTLTNSLSTGMMRNDQKDILKTIKQVVNDTRINQIRVIGHHGQISLSSHENDELHQQGKKSTVSCSICHAGPENKVIISHQDKIPEIRTILEQDKIWAFTPVLNEPGCATKICHSTQADAMILGVIEVSLSIDDVNQTLRQSRTEHIVISIIATIIGGFLMLGVFNRRIRRPMKELIKGISRVSNGDLTFRIKAKTNDEISEVAESFNRMNEKLLKLQNGLIQSERLISMGKLAAGVAHEINNPITGILSYAEDLYEDAEDSDPKKEDYEVIMNETLRCRQIVRNLLDFARQDLPTFIFINPSDLMKKSLSVVIRQAAFRNIKFDKKIENNLPAINADPVQIQQVLVNLIVNAQQAMPNGGKITLSVAAINDGTHIEYLIKDEGHGIPSEIQSHIFEPFFSTKGGKTNGLGLAVCMGIVEQHNGTITLDSERDKGTTFYVVIPVEKRIQNIKKGYKNG